MHRIFYEIIFHLLIFFKIIKYNSDSMKKTLIIIGGGIIGMTIAREACLKKNSKI